MPERCSLDLRERAVTQVAAGKTGQSIAAVLQGSVASLGNDRNAIVGPATPHPA